MRTRGHRQGITVMMSRYGSHQCKGGGNWDHRGTQFFTRSFVRSCVPPRCFSVITLAFLVFRNIDMFQFSHSLFAHQHIKITSNSLKWQYFGYIAITIIIVLFIIFPITLMGTTYFICCIYQILTLAMQQSHFRTGLSQLDSG